MEDKHIQRIKKRFGILEERLGYEFSEYKNLERALTHSSLRKNSDDGFHYEKLEFLGDRVLGLCVAERLYIEFPDADEGELSLRLNALVKGKTLAEVADDLKIHEFIRTGGDLKEVTGKRMQSVRADVIEALIAAIYLDGGLKPAFAFVNSFIEKRLNQPDAARRDSKTALQEWAHTKQLGSPQYIETGKSGPDHDPVFSVEVVIGGKEPGHGSGQSKRAAEQAAAREVLIREGVWRNG